MTKKFSPDQFPETRQLFFGLNLCRNSIRNPLSIIFNGCLKEAKVPCYWKETHAVPVFTKNEINSVKTIDLIPYFQFAAKLLSVFFIMDYSPFLLIISCFFQASQVLDLVTPVLTNYLLLFMKYINRLVMYLKLGEFS